MRDDRDRSRPSVIIKSESITNEEHKIHYENSAVNHRRAHDTAGEKRNYDIETKARIIKSPTPTPAESSSSNSSSDESEIEIIDEVNNKNYDIYAKIKNRLQTIEVENERNITGHRASLPEIKGQEMILPACTENIPEKENIRSLTKLLVGISIRYDTHEAPIIQRAQFEANSGMLDTTTMDEPECENLKVYLENLKGHEVIGHGTKTGLFHYADMSFTKEMTAEDLQKEAIKAQEQETYAWTLNQHREYNMSKHLTSDTRMIEAKIKACNICSNMTTMCDCKYCALSKKGKNIAHDAHTETTDAMINRVRAKINEKGEYYCYGCNRLHYYIEGLIQKVVIMDECLTIMVRSE